MDVFMTEEKNLTIVDNKEIQNMIYTFRGRQVMIDRDLAYLYNVETKVLNQAVKRNLNRFPEHFRFQLTEEEYENLRSQFVTSSEDNTPDRLQKISTKSNFKEILEAIKENVDEKSYSEEDIDKLNSLKIYFEENNSWENSPIDEYVVQKYLIPNLPEFMYYDDYYSLPSRVSLTKLEAQPQESSKKQLKRYWN